jgi:hypothetical protein
MEETQRQNLKSLEDAKNSHSLADDTMESESEQFVDADDNPFPDLDLLRSEKTEEHELRGAAAGKRLCRVEKESDESANGCQENNSGGFGFGRSDYGGARRTPVNPAPR